MSDDIGPISLDFGDADEIDRLRERIRTLEAEVARLRNDLADALDLKNGVGPTVLTALAQERDAAQAEVARLKGLGVPPDEVPEDPRYVIGYQRQQWNFWQEEALAAQARVRELEAYIRQGHGGPVS